MGGGVGVVVVVVVSSGVGGGVVVVGSGVGGGVVVVVVVVGSGVGGGVVVDNWLHNFSHLLLYAWFVHSVYVLIEKKALHLRATQTYVNVPCIYDLLKPVSMF